MNTKPHWPRRAIVISGFCVLHATAWSQVTTEAGMLSPVVVRQQRPAAWVSQILREPTERSSSDDSAAAMEAVPGGYTVGGGRLSALPALRGLSDERLRLSIDGMDLYASCPNHMNTPLSYLTPAQTEVLEVWAGIAPVSMGGDAIGGVVAAQTRPLTFAAAGQTLQSGELGLQLRSNDDGRRSHWRAEYANERFALRYEGGYAQADNYRAGGDFKSIRATGRAEHDLALDEVGSTAYRMRNHVLSAATQSDGHHWEVRVYRQDMPYQLYPNQRMDLLDNRSNKINLRYEGKRDWGQLKAQVWRETVDHFMDFGPDKRYWYGMASGGPNVASANPCSPIGLQCAAGMPMNTDSETIGAKVQADVALSMKDTLRLGAELHRYRLDDYWPPSGAGMWPGTFTNIRDGRRDRNALFAEWESRPSQTWRTLVGLRVERVKTNAGEVQGYSTAPNARGFQARDAAVFNARDRRRNFDAVDLVFMSRHTLGPGLDIEWGVAHKERAPGLYELYPWSTWQMAALMNNIVGDGNGYIGNPDLRSERAQTLSATLDWYTEDRHSSLALTPYLTWISDYIDAVQWDASANAPRVKPVRDQFTVLRYMNQRARLYGLDIVGQMELGRNHWGNWRLRGGLNYTRAKNTVTGDGLYGIMPLNAKVALTQESGGWQTTAEWVLVKAKTRVSSVRNETTTAGYGLLNLRARYRWQDWRFDIGVDNLFDRLYTLPTGGAYVGQGTTMTNPPIPYYPQWGIGVPGPGRTVYVGVTRQF